MTTRRRWPRWSRSVWDRIWWWGGWVLLTPLAVILFQAPPSPWPALLIGPVIVTVWRVVVAMYVVGVTCWALSLVTWVSARSGWRIRSILGSLRIMMVGLAAAAALLAATGTAAISLFVVAADRYHVLAPSSAGGCRVVVRVNVGGINGTSGDVLLATPRSLVLLDLGAGWLAKSEVDPIRAGSWSLAWDGKSARLVVWGDDPKDARTYYPHDQPAVPITCPQ